MVRSCAIRAVGSWKADRIVSRPGATVNFGGIPAGFNSTTSQMASFQNRTDSSTGGRTGCADSISLVLEEDIRVGGLAIGIRTLLGLPVLHLISRLLGR